VRAARVGVSVTQGNQKCSAGLAPDCVSTSKDTKLCTPDCRLVERAVVHALKKARVEQVTSSQNPADWDLQLVVDVRLETMRADDPEAPAEGIPFRQDNASFGAFLRLKGYIRPDSAAATAGASAPALSCRAGQSIQSLDVPLLDSAASEVLDTLWGCEALDLYAAQLERGAGSRALSAASTPPSSSRPSSSGREPPSRSEFVSATPQPASYALIVGIERYRDVPAATGARADAELFAQVARQTLGLTDDHVRVALEDHATRSDVVSGLEWLTQSVPAGGRVYFFFSGHGAPAVDQSTYLLPYDGNPKSVNTSALAMSEVMRRLGDTRAKEVVAFVDSCFSGAGGRSVLPPGARPLMRVKEPPPAAHVGLFTASQADEISGPASGENLGAFTKYLTQGMGTGQADINGDGQISLQELSEWVTPRVARDAKKDNREQHPKLVVGASMGSASNLIVEYGLASK